MIHYSVKSETLTIICGLEIKYTYKKPMPHYAKILQRNKSNEMYSKYPSVAK